MNKKQHSAVEAGEVSLGKEITVRRLGYGAMRLTGPGIWGPLKDRKAALAVLRRAVELGINFIDTADSYGPYANEELIAEALYPYPKDLIIATKGGWERPGPDQWTHNATPAHLREAAEGSLKRLRLDRIDVYQLHTPDPAVSFDASVETLAGLKREGKIRMVALSNVSQEHIERADRHRAKPLQLRRPRVGSRRGLLRTKRNRVHPVVPALRGQNRRRRCQSNCTAASRCPNPGCSFLATATISHDAANSGDILDRTPGRECCRGVPTLE